MAGQVGVFRIGNSVRIINGPFANYLGIINELMADEGRMSVLINFLGHELPVEVNFTQVQKQ